MNKYLINEDLDGIICDMLDPPTILTMTEVNKYYTDILQDLRSEFNQVGHMGLSIENACMKEYIWIAEWILEHQNVDIHTNGEKIFIKACFNGLLASAMWLIEVGDIDIHAHPIQILLIVY